MSDNDLHDIFREEAADYLTGIGGGLLKIELDEGDRDLLTEMRRMAHSLKGAARAVGFERVETISHYLEAIFDAMLKSEHALPPHAADAMYDGLDLIERTLDDTLPDDDERIVVIINQLEAVVSQMRQPDTPADATEIPALRDADLQPAPDDAVSDELLNIFYTEVSDYIAALNDGLLQVEMAGATGDDEDILREMNRVAHSMKGAARAVGFELIERVSHAMEDVFQQVVRGKQTITPQDADVLYDGLDLIQNAVDGETGDPRTVLDVLAALRDLSSDNGAAASYTQEQPPLKLDAPVPPNDKTPEMEMSPSLVTSTIETRHAPTMLMRASDDSLRVSVNKLDQLMADASELLIAKMEGEAHEERLTALRRRHARWQREWRGARAAYIRLVRRAQENNHETSPELDTIFKFLESNQRYLAQANRELAQLNQTLTQDNIHLATVADQLQETVSDLRMMPFESIVGGFQRMVRDMARDLDKKVHFEITGANVEIDKTVLDALRDPLTHLLRNAIDHGLEPPSERIERGKSPTGNLLLHVKQIGSEISITVHDDGRGFDIERIRRKAVERQLLTDAEAANLSDDDVQALVFHSGFSTSDNVTALSGRGLGMDIVRNRVENLRGRVRLYSDRGGGTMVFINVPVSLTRIRAVTMRAGDETYAIPSVMIERMVTVERGAIFTAEGREMLTLNERPMPLVSLAETLGAPTSGKRGDEIQVIALQAADRAIAFEVDDLHDEMELVLKPLGRELQAAPFVAGAALLGTGQVLIVLDANDLVRNGSGINLQPRRAVSAALDVERQTRVLVVDDSITTRTLEKNILENAGFEVYVAIDGAEAWQQLPEVVPDVIVCDVEMPHMDGLEFTERLKRSATWQQIPVILLTSLSKPEQREAGLNAGADAYLVKSRFNQAELLDTIQRVI